MGIDGSPGKKRGRRHGRERRQRISAVRTVTGRFEI